MKASLIVFSLVMINCSCVVGMKTDLESELENFLSPIKVNTLDRTAKDFLVESVKRNMRNEDGQSKIVWPEVRDDLQKVHRNNNALCKKTAVGLCLSDAVNSAWFGSSAMCGIWDGNKATFGQKILTGIALLLMIDNIIQVGDVFSSRKSLPDVRRQNDVYSFIVDYVHANPQDTVSEVINSVELTGKLLAKEDREKLKACALSNGPINMQIVERLFSPQPYFYSMSNDERNMCAFMFFFNMIPAYFCSSVMGPDFTDIGTFMAGLNLIAGLCVLGNPGSVCGNRETERSLNDIIDTIDKHASKKAD